MRISARSLRALLVLSALLALASDVTAAPYPATRRDFELPGTQPLTITDPIATPSACVSCHANYGQPTVEPYRNWRGSMMAQAGRDPLMYAALAIAGQDVSHSGETCIRCHMAKGWLEGRSVPEDATATTAADREGVQCGVCHRLVDPLVSPGNPAADAAILASLTAPVPAPGSAMMVIDPIDRLRGPFNVQADLGVDPHLPNRATLVSPFHLSARLCGTCHDVGNPTFTRNAMGGYDANPTDTPADPTLAFPEQLTYSEWAASAFASGGVAVPQFGGNRDTVSTCQDCHMKAVSGKDASSAIHRDDLPLHELVGANAFIPAVLPFHPVFGAEVDTEILDQSVSRATDMLRRAVTVNVSLAGGQLTVRVTNETGHKLPTGYPDGRRMWLHVRAFDVNRQVVFESGRYVFATGELVGYGALPADPDYDPNLHVWETLHGMSPDWAAVVARPPGPSFHLVLNNRIEKDNRIPPRGFTNAAFAAFGGAPVGATYVDGQHWDDVVYPVGSAATSAGVTLYYQTTSREYVEFLRDENVTNAAGPILFDLWDQHGKGEPVVMARAFYESNATTVDRCQRSVSKAQAKYWKDWAKAWGDCFATEAKGLSCNAQARDDRLAAAESRLRASVGGLRDRSCAVANLTPITLGHGAVCPVPCAGTVTLFDMNDIASCAVCMSNALGGDTLGAAYGAEPPAFPAPSTGDALACQQSLAKASLTLASSWTKALARCEAVNAGSVDCTSDPDGAIAAAKERAAREISRCADFSGLAGCATSGTADQVSACVEAAIGGVAPAFTQVAYP